jgi:hypothetical protein
MSCSPISSHGFVLRADEQMSSSEPAHDHWGCILGRRVAVVVCDHAWSGEAI